MKCKTLTAFLLLNGFFLFLGLILLIAFPNYIQQKLIAKLMYLHEDSTGKSSYITDFWARLPAVHYVKFYIFNVTNQNEVMFHGQDPIVEEIGPFTYAMTEHKENIKYLDDGNLVFFTSNRTWVYDTRRSCPTCHCNTEVTLTNLLYTELVYLARTTKMNVFYRRLLDIVILAFRVTPIKKLKVCELLFDSYNEPLLNVYHLPLVQTLKRILKLKVPDIPDIGYFPKYNKTGDGDYVIKTGKDDIENIGQIVSWNNYTELPWWNIPEKRVLKGSGDGINQRPGIGKNDKFEMFQPLVCRKFFLEYSGHEGHVNGIPTLGYVFSEDTYDGIRDIGYRYENYEKVNYFPGWPCGLNHTVEITSRCENISCNVFENWCDKCCNGSYANGTWVLPPGMFPLKCQPARTFQVPMGVLLSVPHFLWSPPEIRNSVQGLKPDPTLHSPGKFQVNSLSGHTVGAIFRIQFNVPLNPHSGWGWNKVPNKLVPTLWLELSVEPKQYSLDFFYLVIVVLRRVVFIVSLICLGVSAFLTTFLMCKVVKNKKKIRSTELKPIANGTVKKCVLWS